MQTKKLTTLALYTTLSLAIYAVECMLPPLIPIPGIKPGLANIITLIVLESFSAKDTFFVLIARILLSSLLFGQAMSFLYSLAGGLACFLMMFCINRLLNKHMLPITSMFGALAHNVAQLCIAYLFTRTIGIISYLPFLLLSALVTGLFTGLAAHFLLRYLSPHIKHLSETVSSD